MIDDLSTLSIFYFKYIRPVVVIELEDSKYQSFKHDHTGEHQETLRLSTDIGWHTGDNSIGGNQLKIFVILSGFNIIINSPQLWFPEAKTEQKRTS